MWSRKHEQCIICGTTEVGHHAHGLCHTCDKKKYNDKANPILKELRRVEREAKAANDKLIEEINATMSKAEVEKDNQEKLARKKLVNETIANVFLNMGKSYHIEDKAHMVMFVNGFTIYLPFDTLSKPSKYSSESYYLWRMKKNLYNIIKEHCENKRS